MARDRAARPPAGYTPFQVSRFGIAVFNLLLGVAAAAALALAARREPFSTAAFLGALRISWWAGLGVGLTVAAGATLGRRPVLPLHRCLLAQMGILASSVLGGLVGSLFPQEVARVDRIFHSLLDHEGIVIGAGVGTVLGTAWQVFRVYRMRRRAEREVRERA